jgi:hypothetical protein
MKRAVFLSLVIAVALAVPLTAQQYQAVVREFAGKVEVKTADQDWQPVTLNMVIAKGATISTGFNSRLVLEMGLTRLTVNPLTRMLFEELVKKDVTNTASLVLKVGKVNASVKSAQGEKTDFTLKGPASTAAVRGTEFSYDGYELQVAEGIVQFFNLLSQARGVGAGETSDTDGYSFPTGGENNKRDDSTVSGNAGGGLTGSGGGGGGGTYTPPALTGTFAVTLN